MDLSDILRILMARKAETKTQRITRYCIQDLKIKYDPVHHIPLLLDLFKAGAFICDFCDEAEICADTFHEWVKVHPEFKRAYVRARRTCERWWIQKGLEGMNTPGFNQAVWSAIMKNKFDMTDTRKVKVKGLLKAKTATEQHRAVSRMAAAGELTTHEASQLANFVKIGAEIEEKTELKKEVEEIKTLLGRQSYLCP